MIPIAILLSLLMAPASMTLVLSSGEKIPISEIVSVKDDVVLFRDRSGTLYSIKLDEVDLTASTDPSLAGAVSPDLLVLEKPPAKEIEIDAPDEKTQAEIMERFYETVREGTPPPESIEPIVARETTQDRDRDSADEEYWRSQARRHRERLVGLEHRLEAAKERERTLNDQILFLVGESGDASVYSYLVTELESVRASIPQIEETIETANREWFEFQEEARKQGIMPGWLR